MGQMTRAEIVSEGMLLAGRDDIADRAIVWLQTWLDSVAASWPWPCNTRENLVVPVTQGVASVSVGNGDGGVSEKILRIVDNIWIYTSTYTGRNQLRISQFASQPAAILNPASNLGQPTKLRLTQPSGFGKWTLGFDTVPDKAYLLVLDYITLPAALASDSSVPWFPNDVTMINYIKARTMLYDDGQTAAYQAALEEVSQGLANDKVRYGSAPGHNTLIQLDTSVFK